MLSERVKDDIVPVTTLIDLITHPSRDEAQTRDTNPQLTHVSRVPAAKLQLAPSYVFRFKSRESSDGWVATAGRRGLRVTHL